MEPNIKLLEERVVQTVERLRALSAERDRLRQDLQELKTRLSDAREGGDPPGGGRVARADEIARVLKLAVEELKEG